ASRKRAPTASCGRAAGSIRGCWHAPRSPCEGQSTPRAFAGYAPARPMLPLSLLALLPLIVPPQQPDPPPTTQAPAHTAGPRRAVRPKAIANALPVHATQRRVVVKLAEARPELLAAGKPIAAELLAVTGARPLQPFFAGLATELQALRKRQ